ncbi:MAG: hypothetical protein HC902_07835 [Calothrix sp. SM1_5_4]|nr:hypothetical protein [Calothrix sp. SM1_5_4]
MLTHASVQIWGQKSSSLISQSISKDLPKSDSRRYWSVGADFYYEINKRWRPYLGYEYSGHIVTAGVYFGI